MKFADMSDGVHFSCGLRLKYPNGVICLDILASAPVLKVLDGVDIGLQSPRNEVVAVDSIWDQHLYLWDPSDSEYRA